MASDVSFQTGGDNGGGGVHYNYNYTHGLFSFAAICLSFSQRHHHHTEQNWNQKQLSEGNNLDVMEVFLRSKIHYNDHFKGGVQTEQSYNL